MLKFFLRRNISIFFFESFTRAETKYLRAFFRGETFIFSPFLEEIRLWYFSRSYLSHAYSLWNFAKLHLSSGGLAGSNFLFAWSTGLESECGKRDTRSHLAFVGRFSQTRIEERKTERRTGITGEIPASVMVQGEYTVIGYTPFLMRGYFREN